MRKPLWTKEEEIEFVKDISNGKELNDLAGKYNRSANALGLRLKKIIYDNIESGRSEKKLANITKISEDKIKQYYYEYKGFIEKKNKTIEKNKNLEGGGDQSIQNSDNNSYMNKIDKMEKENKIMNTIIQNIHLKKDIHKLIKSGVIDPKIKQFIKKVK
ncbi:hypothetical protein Catovirus_1_839 [Catovirus CTV1]|uniref:Uncharacterized protein n=1 Tax=Catovirus CTV1 TaxID=1977631 RepID=A0A1V0SAR0_9VIRU|nr:hypothetical protein Catovirus_1_839 [Catovirus CTV1]